MGLIALILSVVIDLIRPREGRRPERARRPSIAEAAAAAGHGAPTAEQPIGVPASRAPKTPAGARVGEAAEATGEATAGATAETTADAMVDSMAETAAEAPTGAPTGATPAAPNDRFAESPAGRFTESADRSAETPAERFAEAELRDHPTTPAASWLIRRFGTSLPDAADRLELGVAGWSAVVALPVIAIGAIEAFAGAILGLFAFLVHVAVLYLTVGLGPFQRIFGELRLLIGAGETASVRTLLRRWDGVDQPPIGPHDDAAAAIDDAGPGAAAEVEREASARSLLVAFRDVAAPLFWYLVLPGAVGAVGYLFARQAAVRARGFARDAYRWIDWIPLRVGALAFALAGKFEETIDCLKALGASWRQREPGAGNAADDALDPYAHQRLFVLPVAGAALGCAVTDTATEASLRHRAPDLEPPGADAPVAVLASTASLLTRSGMIGLGLYLLVALLG
ncbi:MAG: hypothetical protein AB7G13_08955 [Lautropia sp.]